MEFELVIDHREGKLLEILDRDYPETYISESLDIGDIVIRDKETKEIKILIERKTFSDLYSSIRDGRHREQKERILAHIPAQSVFYLIEGSSYRLNDMRRKAIDGSILNTILRDKCHIIHSCSVMSSVQIVRSIFKKYTENPQWFITITNQSQSQDINESTGGGLNNRSPVPYQDLIKLKKKENMTPEICQHLFLAQIPGMSHQISRIVFQKYNNLKNLFVSLSTSSDPIMDLSSIEMELTSGKKRKLGKVLARRIVTALFREDETFL